MRGSVYVLRVSALLSAAAVKTALTTNNLVWSLRQYSLISMGKAEEKFFSVHRLV